MVRIREKLKINPENLLALHALSGNDTVAACHGIGKGKALKVLREHGSLSFNLLGDLSCDFDALHSMAVQFLSLCYGIKPEDQQSSIIPTRIKVWYRKVSINTHYNPSLKQIPPTDNSFREEPTTKQQYGDRVKHRILLKIHQIILDGIRTTSME